MKITILAHDVSENNMGRAYLLGKLLRRRYEVEIVGPAFGNGIWQPIADDRDITYKWVKVNGRFRPYRQLWELSEMVEGDVVYVSKLLLTSMLPGLLAKRSGKSLIVDIDDWEVGFAKFNWRMLPPHAKVMTAFFSTLYAYQGGSYTGRLLAEKLARYGDDITVSNQFLKEKFGGTIIYHGRDTEAFDPAKFDRAALREKHGFASDEKVVMFFGTPRPYKGIEDLLEAFNLIPEENIILAIVGLGDDPYSKGLSERLSKRIGKRFRGFGPQPFGSVPEFLSAADIVAVPQRKNIATRGQVPAKIFDAMAMAKPIISTDVSDIREILSVCGWVIEPEYIERLAATIRYVASHPEEAEEAGRRARAKCVDYYSWNALAKKLISIFEKYE